MSRCIDADALEELFREVIGGIAKKPEMNGNLEHMVRASAMVIEMIQDAPTIEPQRKKGKWIYLDKDKRFFHPHIVKCSVCNNTLDMYGVNAGRGDANFCPNCGSFNGGENEV